MLSRRTILLKPMLAAVSGYARLQTENGRTLVQLHARGLSEGQVRLFGYLADRVMRELGNAHANAHGEISMEVSSPPVLQALIVLDASPRPLLIGLCASSDAGSMLDVKNAALALCERLKRPALPKDPPSPPKNEAPARPVLPVPTAKPIRSPKVSDPPILPREIFLPAIDPAPYTLAGVSEEKEESILPPPKPSGPPADRLHPLRWPRGFERLKEYFESRMPISLLALPGWRFVCAAQGLWIGRMAQDGRVCRIAYACQGQPPADLPNGWQPMQGRDGALYQLLWMDV